MAAKLRHPLKAGIERTGCDVLCAVGIKTFIKALNKTDLAPSTFARSSRPSCRPRRRAGTVDGNAVSPAIATQGTAVQMQLQFSVINATGVGEIRVAVKGEHAGDPSVGQSFINTVRPRPLRDQHQPHGAGRPSAQPPVRWTPGTYTYAFEAQFLSTPARIARDATHDAPLWRLHTRRVPPSSGAQVCQGSAARAPTRGLRLTQGTFQVQ